MELVNSPGTLHAQQIPFPTCHRLTSDASTSCFEVLVTTQVSAWLEGKYLNRRNSGLLLPCTVSMRHYSKISYRYQNMKMLKSLIKNGLVYRLHPLRSVEAMETHSFQFKFGKGTPPKVARVLLATQAPPGLSSLP